MVKRELLVTFHESLREPAVGRRTLRGSHDSMGTDLFTLTSTMESTSLDLSSWKMAKSRRQTDKKQGKDRDTFASVSTLAAAPTTPSVSGNLFGNRSSKPRETRSFAKRVRGHKPKNAKTTRTARNPKTTMLNTRTPHPSAMIVSTRLR